MKKTTTATTPHYPCPACGALITWSDTPYRPFCSERCKLLDLGKWAMEEYRVPGEPITQEPASSDDEQSDT